MLRAERSDDHPRIWGWSARSLDAAIHQPYRPRTPIRSPAFQRKEGCPEGSPPNRYPRTGPGPIARCDRAFTASALLAVVPRSSDPFDSSRTVRRYIVETTATEAIRFAPATRDVYGVNDLELDLAGRRIGAVYTVLEQVLNIPREASVTVNGGRVDEEYVVRPGDEIEFLKSAGVKGQQA